MLQSADISIQIINSNSKRNLDISCENNPNFRFPGNFGDIQISDITEIKNIILTYGNELVKRRFIQQNFIFLFSYLFGIAIFSYNAISLFTGPSIFGGSSILIFFLAFFPLGLVLSDIFISKNNSSNIDFYLE